MRGIEVSKECSGRCAAAKRGPATEAGKAAVSQNAVQHGILFQSPVVSIFEREQDWAEHRDGIVESLKPEGQLEQALADRIAQLLWRLQLVVRYETQSIAAEAREVEQE